MPIGIRSLESMLRLATAYAKLRLAKNVEMVDAVNSLKLYMKAYYGGYQEISPNFFKEEFAYLELGREKKVFKRVKSSRISER